MTFKFDELLLKGQEAANVVEQNKVEIEGVFSELKTSLAAFLSFDIHYCEKLEKENEKDASNASNALSEELRAISQINYFRPKVQPKYTGYKLVSLESVNKVSAVLFKYKESSEGYPIVLGFEKQLYNCFSKEELGDALGLMVSDSSLHLKLKSFKAKVNTN